MKIENNMVTFEYLSAISSSAIGEDAPVTAKAESFTAKNAPGEPGEVENLRAIENLGKAAISNLNKLFA